MPDCITSNSGATIGEIVTITITQEARKVRQISCYLITAVVFFSPSLLLWSSSLVAQPSDATGTIAGLITHATDYGDTITVALHPVDPTPGRTIRNTTPENGRFRLDNIPTDQTFNLLASSYYLETVTIPNVQAGMEDIVIAMPELRTLDVTVRDASSGVPVTEYVLSVWAYKPDQTTPVRGKQHRVRNTEGRFRIPVPLTEKCKVSIWDPEYVTAWSEEFPVRSGVDPAPLKLALERGCTLSGRVVSASTAEPLADVVVRIVPRTEHVNQRVQSSARTSRDGTFALKGVPPGEYELTFTPWHRRQDSFLPREIPIDVTATRDIGDVSLNKGGRVVGRILWEDGEPVSSGRIAAPAGYFGLGYGRSTEISATGTYALDRVREGSCNLFLSIHPDPGKSLYLHPELQRVSITPGHTHEVDFHIPRGRLFRGTVSVNGKPLQNGTIKAMRESDVLPGRELIHEGAIRNGTYNLRVLTKGKHAINIVDSTAEYGHVLTVTIEEPRGQQDLDIAVVPCKVSGHVLDTNGFRINAWASLYPAGLSEDEAALWRIANRYHTRPAGGITGFVPAPGEYVFESLSRGDVVREPILHVAADGVRDFTKVVERKLDFPFGE